jgi:DNA-binding NtrC family response regulator
LYAAAQARAASVALNSASGTSPRLVDLRCLERDYINRLMSIYGGDREKVAQIAGISVRSLYRKLQKGLTE